MTRSADELRTVGDLAALGIDAPEAAALEGHFSKLFDHLKALQTIPTEGIEAYFSLPNRLLPRESDIPKASRLDAAIRSTFAESGEDFLIVKRVVTRGEE